MQNPQLTSSSAVISYVKDFYDCSVDFPWQTSPTFGVLRHVHSKTWFGLVMTISLKTLGISDSDDMVDAINLKADPFDVEFFASQPGFAPAYHMNKTHWVTVILDGTISDQQIESMIADSYRLTAKAADR